MSKIHVFHREKSLCHLTKNSETLQDAREPQSVSFTLAGTTDRHPDDHCPQRYGIRRRHCCRVALAACGRSLLRLCLIGQAASPCSACAGSPHSSRSSRLTSFLCLTRRRLSVHQQTKTIDSHATDIEADCNSIVAWRDCGELFETGSPRPSEGTRSAVSNRIYRARGELVVTGVGLIPLALGAGQPGKEIQQPMAVVILGGIVTSTFLNMIVIPPLYFKYGSAGVRVEDEVYSAGAEGSPAGD